jgi:hypothetical protein
MFLPNSLQCCNLDSNKLKHKTHCANVQKRDRRASVANFRAAFKTPRSVGFFRQPTRGGSRFDPAALVPLLAKPSFLLGLSVTRASLATMIAEVCVRTKLKYYPAARSSREEAVE